MVELPAPSWLDSQLRAGHFECVTTSVGRFLIPTLSIWDCFWFTDSQPLAKYIASLDPRYNSLFMDNIWKEAFEHSDTTVGESRCLCSLFVFAVVFQQTVNVNMPFAFVKYRTHFAVLNEFILVMQCFRVVYREISHE